MRLDLDPGLLFLLLFGVLAVALRAALLVGWRRAGPPLRRLPRRLARAGAGGRLRRWRAGFARHLPRTEAALARRLATDRFTGLPLTLVLVAAAYLLVLLSGVVEAVIEAEEVVAFDAALAALTEPLRTPALVAVLAWVTRLADYPALVAVVIVATGFLWADRRSEYILPLWVTILGAQATTWIGKFGFGRARPEFLTEVIAHSPAFPSAHATSALAVYGFIAYAIARDTPSPRQRFDIGYATAVLVALIAASRVILTVHYASDVAAGLLLGAFWLLVGFALCEWRRAGARL